MQTYDVGAQILVYKKIRVEAKSPEEAWRIATHAMSADATSVGFHVEEVHDEEWYENVKEV